jgi:wobble nucleotide-excising tRNase
MKIKKLSKLNNVYSYSHFEWDQLNVDSNNPSNPSDIFMKNNIIFGENGNGKSNLIKLYKAINSGSVVFEKHRDKQSYVQEIVIDLVGDDPQVTFTGLGWSNDSLKSKFLIFDKDYIETYVHSLGSNCDDPPERRQQRGKNIVYLGCFTEYNAEINKVFALRSDLNDKNEEIFFLEEAKFNGLLVGIDIDVQTVRQNKVQIDALKKKDLPDKKNQQTKLLSELEKIEKSLKEKDNIVKLLPLSVISAEISLKSQSNPKKSFLFTVAQGVLKTLHKIERKKDFVRTGLSLLSEDGLNCPFCEQKIKNGEYLQIIKDYQDIFNESFASEEVVVKAVLSKYEQLLENLLEIKHPSENQTRINSDQQFIVFDSIFPDVGLSDEQRTKIKAEIYKVHEKQNSLLNKIESSQYDEIVTIVSSISEQIKSYNEVIKKFNTKLEQFKKDSNEGKLGEKKDAIVKAISTLKTDILFIENKKIVDDYFSVSENYENNKKVIASLDRISQSLKTKILDEFNNFVREYFDLIKGYVKTISPSMEILDIRGQATYDRRSQQEPAQCGFRIKYNGEDCTNSLSEGEKQVVALAFFFAQLKKEADKSKIVVLDDPITSFDAGKRKSVAELIDKETKDYDQLFVLTCDPLFREYCLKQIDDRNFYYVFKTLGSSSIHYYKIGDAKKFVNLVCDKFEDDFGNIDRVAGQDDNIIVYGQKLRFCLETKIKENYFGYSQDKLSLMIEQVAKNGNLKLKKLIENKDKIIEIYRYCNTGGLAHYPRDGSTSWNELKGKVQDYLSLSL